MMVRQARPVLALLALFLIACSGGQTATPEPTLVQVTPLATDTTVPPTATSAPAEPNASAQPTLPTVAELREKIDFVMTSTADDDRFDGVVLVARGDEIILSKGYGLSDRENRVPNTIETKFRIASLTKAFTSMAIMQLQDQGLVHVDDPICTYLPDCPEIWQDITIHQMLKHTSGIIGDIPGATTSEATPMPPATYMAEIADIALNFQPGTEFSYSNSGFILLGLIIEAVSGQSYEAYLQEHILDPLGMADTGYDHGQTELAVGYVNQFQKASPVDLTSASSAGALYSTVGDMFRWARAQVSETLVSSATLDAMHTSNLEDGSPESGVGYGWFIGTLEDHPMINHSGGINGYTSHIVILPADGLTIVVLSNREDVSAWIYGDILAGMVFAAD